MSSLPEPGAAPNFETWFRKSAAQLLRQAYYFTRDPELAEDIAQDAAVKVFKAWPDEETRSKILTQPGYVRAIVYHCFLDYIKVPPGPTTEKQNLRSSGTTGQTGKSIMTCAGPYSALPTMSAT
jgi:DNA-directed RNA polymerase specialized sigma24 family protein